VVKGHVRERHDSVLAVLLVTAADEHRPTGALSGAVEPGEWPSLVSWQYGYHRNMDLAEKKIAILVDNFYQEMEVWYPLFRFQEAGATVITVGAKAGETYASKLGYPVKCQLSYDDVQAADFDGVVVPGGYAPDHIRRHPKAN
jgi:hypothetical protein